VRSLCRRLAPCSCVCGGCRRHYGGVRRGFVVVVVVLVVVVVVRGASVLKLKFRYFNGAWIAGISCVAFVVVAVRKPALVLAVFLMHVP
jgi:hypothetical protein